MKAQQPDLGLKFTVFLLTLSVWYFYAIPVYIHLSFYLSLAVWAWTTNLHGLFISGINPLVILETSNTSHSILNPLYNIAMTMSLASCAFAILYSQIHESVSHAALEWVAIGYYSFWMSWFVFYRPNTSPERSLLKKYIKLTKIALQELYGWLYCCCSTF